MATDYRDGRTYWAAETSDKICSALCTRIDNYFQFVRASGRLALWTRIWRQYYAGMLEGAAMMPDGDTEELIGMQVNDFRNLVQHLIVLTAGQRPAFQPRANNSDHKSQTQTILAAGILDYVMHNKRLERVAKEALELGLLMGGGYGVADWNATAGTEVQAGNCNACQGMAVDPAQQPCPACNGTGVGGVEKAGDLDFWACGPLEAVHDFTRPRADAHQWWCLRTYRNRYDLAAKYPVDVFGAEVAQRIIGLPIRPDNVKRPRFVNLYRYDTDDVELWQFRHARTDALPDGRLVIFAEPDVLLYDGPLPFRDINVFPLLPANMIGTAGGYSPVFDLLAPQEAINALYTTIASNQAAFGVQNVCIPNGSDLDVADLGGLKIVKYDPKYPKPEGLNLTSTPPEIFTFLNLLKQANETNSGINAVRRGDPAQALGKNASGSALALLDAKAIEFQSTLQQQWVDFLEDMGSATLNLYRDFAKAPQVAMLAGKNNRSYLKEFTGADLDRIDRVTVELGNPLARTTSGRTQIAQDLLANGLVKTAEEYLMVITTGRLEPVMEGTQKELLTVKEENESLADGSQPAIAISGQNHPIHIREHLAAVGSPSSQTDPEAIQRVLAHVQEHVMLWKTDDPAILAACGVPPPPMMMPPPGMAPGGLPPGGEPPPAMPPGVAEGQPNMPQMPVNPQSGERAAPPPSPVMA